MNKDSVLRFINLAKDKTIKNSPKILLGVSLISGTAALVFAIKGTRNLEPVLDFADEELSKIKKCKEEIPVEDYPVSLYRKDLASTYMQIAQELGKIYWPMATCALISGASSTLAVGKLSKELAGATAFGAAIFAEFTDYRGRVSERYGEQAEYEIYNNIHQETVEVKTDNGKGKVKTSKEVTDVVGDNKSRSTSFFVGKDYCKNWEDGWNRDENKDFLKLRISQAEPALNRELARKGYVHLSRIMELCDVHETELSRHLAIVYDPYYDPYSKLDKNGNPTAQIHLDVNDAGLLEGDEKVLLVTIDGLTTFNVDDFDFPSLFKSKEK